MEEPRRLNVLWICNNLPQERRAIAWANNEWAVKHVDWPIVCQTGNVGSKDWVIDMFVDQSEPEGEDGPSP